MRVTHEEKTAVTATECCSGSSRDGVGVGRGTAQAEKLEDTVSASYCCAPNAEFTSIVIQI
jgi:transketolase N-terminal domain/subunit